MAQYLRRGQKDDEPGDGRDTTHVRKIYDFYEAQHDVKNRVHESAIHKIFGASGSFMLIREVDEYLEQEKEIARMTTGKDDFQGLEAGSVQKRFLKPNMLSTSWEEHKPGETSRVSQIALAVKMMADSRGAPLTGLDVQTVEFLMQSCGEEMESEEYEQVMRMCAHSTKGKFDVTKILKTYAELAVKVGTLDKSAMRDVDDMCKQITAKKPRHIPMSMASLITKQDTQTAPTVSLVAPTGSALGPSAPQLGPPPEN
jgi:hypothetical protein